MSDDSVRREFVALSIPFQFISEKLYNKFGLFLLYICGCITTYYILSDRIAPWWIYIIGSLIWTIVSGFVLVALVGSASIADLVAEAMLDRLIKETRPSNLVHRFAHAVLALAIFSVVFGMTILSWFGYFDDGCGGGRYPRC